MTSKGKISHVGRVVEITPEFTSVEIISESVCSACHAASLCGLSEFTRKAVQVPSRGWDNYKVGEEVEVLLRASMGHKAVWIAYVAPLAVLVIVLLSVLGLGAGELVAALAAFASTAVYYLVIYLLRDTLRREYVFEIAKKSK